MLFNGPCPRGQHNNHSGGYAHGLYLTGETRGWKNGQRYRDDICWKKVHFSTVCLSWSVANAAKLVLLGSRLSSLHIPARPPHSCLCTIWSCQLNTYMKQTYSSYLGKAFLGYGLVHKAIATLLQTTVLLQTMIDNHTVINFWAQVL